MGMGRTLSAIFNHAIEDGILTSNPAQRPGRYIRTGDRRLRASHTDVVRQRPAPHLHDEPVLSLLIEVV